MMPKNCDRCRAIMARFQCKICNHRYCGICAPIVNSICQQCKYQVTGVPPVVQRKDPFDLSEKYIG